jgi:pimeloyl-ACP methyl ester carboxylesterase
MTVMRVIHVAGQRLCVQALRTDTAGLPVILLHGIGGSVRFWHDDQVDLFATQGPCYALSLPGHYPAAFPVGFRRSQLTVDLIAHVLGKAIHKLVGDQPVTLVGFSTGGFAALAVAATTPQWVQRVVCISGFAQGRWTGALGVGQWLARQMPPELGYLLFGFYYTLGGLSRLSRTVFYHAWRVYAADVQAAYAYPHFRTYTDVSHANFARLDLKSLVHYFAVMPHIDISAMLPLIQAPTLVIAGDQDPIVPPAQARLISEHVPNAELVMIAGGGHLLFAERPDEYRQALAAWLNRTG